MVLLNFMWGTKLLRENDQSLSSIYPEGLPAPNLTVFPSEQWGEHPLRVWAAWSPNMFLASHLQSEQRP